MNDTLGYLVYFGVPLLGAILIYLALTWWRKGADPALIDADIRGQDFIVVKITFMQNPIAYGIIGDVGRVYEVIVRHKDGSFERRACAVSLLSGVLWKTVPKSAQQVEPSTILP